MEDLEEIAERIAETGALSKESARKILLLGVDESAILRLLKSNLNFGIIFAICKEFRKPIELQFCPNFEESLKELQYNINELSPTKSLEKPIGPKEFGLKRLKSKGYK